MRLSGLHLRCADPATLAAFYTGNLGMKAQDDGRLGYAGQDADLVLHPGGGGYAHDPGQRYWKIGITLPNLDDAVRALRAKGVAVSEPKQFLDIGYMAHLSDPEGFVIELLQWDFEGNRASDAGDPDAPFAEARIGQITLRSGDIQVDTAYWKDLGMRLLSVQDVNAYGFDLHFLAFTDEHPPLPDLWAAGNREWLWRRPYTVLEFQHVENAVFAPVPDLLGIEVAGLGSAATDPSGVPVLPG
ncbi:VOC family protein [Ruegeria sp. 2012CJ41-6]|uniref:VOC family protein n=1 Tax=Ruegeria spongiae TaxID=2942209 RepID=A0ABT0Q453_9RHOB|nr:VOC family protein [Ruegeria spongiae]MCL6284650.1 VOC family protein [Ruegeria spongiae]